MLYRPNQEKLGFLRKARRAVNGLGRSCRCRVCGKSFFRFSKYRGGWQAVSDYLKEVEWTGSDFDRFWCPFCRSHDRERHLFLYFDALGLWDSFRNAAVLHFAPEKHLAAKIEACAPALYVKGDLCPSRDGVDRMDVTAIPYAEGTFDWVICNHVLEHVPDDAAALREMCRVMKPGGWAVLQTPFARKLDTTRENEEGVATEAARREFYGQEDHVRLYGTDLFGRIRAAGLELRLAEHSGCLPSVDAAGHGVNREEPLFLCVKP